MIKIRKKFKTIPKKQQTILLLILITLFVFLLALFIEQSLCCANKKAIAKKLVLNLYDFASTDDLSYRRTKLSQMTTKDVYNQLTFDNEERMLTTYQKFSDNSSTVIFRRVTNDYVIYSIRSGTIETCRYFVMFYKINKLGKVSFVRESELNTFVVGEP